MSAKMAAMKTKIEGVYDGPMQQVCPHLLVHMQMTCRNTLMASAAVCYWCRLMPESSSYIQYMLQVAQTLHMHVYAITGFELPIVHMLGDFQTAGVVLSSTPMPFVMLVATFDPAPVPIRIADYCIT